MSQILSDTLLVSLVVITTSIWDWVWSGHLAVVSHFPEEKPMNTDQKPQSNIPMIPMSFAETRQSRTNLKLTSIMSEVKAHFWLPYWTEAWNQVELADQYVCQLDHVKLYFSNSSLLGCLHGENSHLLWFHRTSQQPPHWLCLPPLEHSYQSPSSPGWCRISAWDLRALHLSPVGEEVGTDQEHGELNPNVFPNLKP